MLLCVTEGDTRRDITAAFEKMQFAEIIKLFNLIKTTLQMTIKKNGILAAARKVIKKS